MVNDYINGSDIDSDLLDELENNTDFMIEVIETSNDKKMYQFCSDNVLKDFKFISFFIQKFNKDIKLADKLVEDFKKNRNNQELFDFEADTLNIIMCDLTKNLEEIDEVKIKYKICSNIFKKLILSFLKNEEKHSTFEDLGFNIVEALLEEYDILKNYMAKFFINEIFYNDNKLEESLHKNIKSKEYLNSEKIDSFMLEYIKYYDIALSNYTSYEMDLLDGLKKDLTRIYNRWDDMTKFYNRKKVEMFRDALSHFYDYNEDNEPSFSYTELEACIVKNLHLENIFNETDEYNSNLYDYEIETVDTNNAKKMEEDFDYKNKNDFKFIKFAIDTAKKIFFQNEEVEFDLYVQKDKLKQKKKQMFLMIYIEDENS